MPTTTTNYALNLPTVGSDDDQWGTYLNTNFTKIDLQLKTLNDSIADQDLEELGNVVNTTPAEDQVLQFNGQNWSASTLAIADIAGLQAALDDKADDSDLTGITTNPADGSISYAKLNTALQVQVDRILLTDDDATPGDNQILKYSTTDSEWKYADLPGSTVQTLSDVSTAALADDALLVYNSTAGEFQFESGATLRTTLGVDISGTDNSTPVTLSGSLDYLTLSGQAITLQQVNLTTDVTDTLPVTSGGTGSATASDARTALGVSIGSDVQAWDQQLDDISALAVTDGNIIVGNGTTWVAESGATARASLGLTIGTNVQAFDQALTDISNLAVTNGNFIVGDGTNWVAESGAVARASLGLGTVATTDSDAYANAAQGELADSAVQPSDLATTLNTSSTNVLLGRSTAGAGSVEEISLTSAGRALLDDADSAAQRTTLGLGFFATRSIILGFTSLGGFPPTAEFISYVTYNDDQVLFNKIDLNDQYNFENSLAVSLGGTGGTTASAARTNLGLGTLATQDSITESQISDLQTYLTASSTATLTNKSGNISQWTNDAGYLTAETNNLSTVSGTLGTANGGTGLTTIGTAGQVLKVNSGATALEFADESGGGGSGSSYIEHSSTVSDSLAISIGTKRMYVGGTDFSSGGVTMAGTLVVVGGYANFTSASALNITGTLNVI
jgi:hypothetical protein